MHSNRRIDEINEYKRLQRFYTDRNITLGDEPIFVDVRTIPFSNTRKTQKNVKKLQKNS